MSINTNNTNNMNNMTRKPAKQKSNTLSAKLLITAASITITIGGAVGFLGEQFTTPAPVLASAPISLPSILPAILRTITQASVAVAQVVPNTAQTAQSTFAQAAVVSQQPAFGAHAHTRSSK